MKSSNVKRVNNIAQRLKIPMYSALLNALRGNTAESKVSAMQFAAFVLELFDKVEKLDSASRYGGSRYLYRRPTGCELIPALQKVE